jgi:hypothetical protein
VWSAFSSNSMAQATVRGSLECAALFARSGRATGVAVSARLTMWKRSHSCCSCNVESNPISTWKAYRANAKHAPYVQVRELTV